MGTFKEKDQRLQEILSEDVVDMTNLRALCYNGIPESGDRREVCWKLLLNYLPPERARWGDTLAKNRALYREYMDEIIVKPGLKSRTITQQAECPLADPLADHPLNESEDSEWQQYFKDNEVLIQIDKDCRRLFPDYAFFQRPTEYPNFTSDSPDQQFDTLRKRVELTVLQSLSVSYNRFGITTYSSPQQVAEFSTLGDEHETHWEVIERILFVYAKLNPGTGYVQGMNELAGPIYHVFANSPTEDSRRHAEADSFFCFVNVMAEIRDIYTKSLDNSSHGILNSLSRVMKVLSETDFELYISMGKQAIHPQFFAFRWLSLLFTQEFHLPDIQRLWDTLFSDEKRFRHCLFVAVAMITMNRAKILEENFNETMRVLQSYDKPLDQTLARADEISQMYQQKKKKHKERNGLSRQDSTSRSRAASSPGDSWLGNNLKRLQTYAQNSKLGQSMNGNTT